jgi:hypothetical protein
MSHERRRLIYSAVSFAVTSTISARSGVSSYAVVMDEMAAASGGFFLPSVCFYLFESLGVSPAVHVVLTSRVFIRFFVRHDLKKRRRKKRGFGNFVLATDKPCPRCVGYKGGD